MKRGRYTIADLDAAELTGGEARDTWLARNVREADNRSEFIVDMAERLGVSRSRVRQLIKRGRLKIDGKW